MPLAAVPPTTLMNDEVPPSSPLFVATIDTPPTFFCPPIDGAPPFELAVLPPDEGSEPDSIAAPQAITKPHMTAQQYEVLPSANDQ